MKKNITSQILFEEQCIVDEAKVFYFEGRVLRAIYNEEQAILFKKILNDGTLKTAFDTGLVKTKIADDICINNCRLIIEHEKIEFFLHPVEMTDKMFYESALTFINIAKDLSRFNLILKDAHPWNLTYHKGKPVFFDFSSITESNKYYSHWVEEFYTYFAVPLKLAKSRWKLFSEEYRRQHLYGFGIRFFKLRRIKKYFFKDFHTVNAFLNKPSLFLQKLEDWVCKLSPASSSGAWDEYDQAHDTNYDRPLTSKQKFVSNVLKTHKPNKVIDFATNKGYYAFMAEHYQAKVIAFDYESFSIDEGLRYCLDKNITFCKMNFILPTPSYGWSLTGPDAFKRFKSDVGLALGLIHHICLVQKFPVKLFCDTCSNYSKNGVLLEFVFPDDIHVKKWNAEIPSDYTLDDVKLYFGKYFKEVDISELLTDGDIKRQLLFFHN